MACTVGNSLQKCDSPPPGEMPHQLILMDHLPTYRGKWHKTSEVKLNLTALHPATPHMVSDAPFNEVHRHRPADNHSELTLS